MHISHKTQADLSRPRTVILGCGNTLLGDDGFGPAVIARLEEIGLPQAVQATDVGTSIREQLIDYLMAPQLRPQVLVVVDAAYRDGIPAGSVWCCRPQELPACKAHDFSLHQFPTVNLLAELEAEAGMQVALVLAQATTLPQAIAPGLSPAMMQAVEQACTLILQRLGEDVINFSSSGVCAAAEGVS